MNKNKKSGLDFLFRPESVAVIGASDRTLTIGNRIVKNLIEVNFNGAIYPVNPNTPEILGKKTYPEIKDVPYEIDLAHIIVKNTLVPGLLKDCALKGVKVAIINTAGFKETGGDGARLEDEIIDIARETGIRVFGPNCQGIINTDPAINAYCNFTYTRSKPGNISIISQSGGMGEAINNRLCELDEGLRIYSSSGNTCDIQCSEMLEYLDDDPETKVIICHFESIGNMEHFKDVTRQISENKPVLGMFTGKTLAGSRAVKYHTGGMIPGGIDEQSIFRETGVLPFSTVDEICQAARAFVHMPVPGGSRMGIVTNTGGAGIVAADELILGGCTLPDLSLSAVKTLQSVLLKDATISNPVDLLATADADHFSAAIDTMIKSPGIDGLLLSFITPFFVDCRAIAEKVTAIVKKTDKPVACVVMTDKHLWASTLEIFRKAGIPTFDVPETGARILASLAKYGKRHVL